MKAFLLNNGYQLYREIWNDQPPLLTHILASSFNIFEPSVNLSRSLVLLFSTLLLWQTWIVLYLFGGIIHALVGSLFLIVSPHYLRLSISVMIGLPSLTLAMGAISTIILWHSTHKTRWLIFSALLLSMSILIKLFTFFLAPIIVLGIFLDRVFVNKSKRINWKKSLQLPILWTAIFACSTLLLLAFLVGYDHLYLLIDNHTSARAIAAFQNLSLNSSIEYSYGLFLCCLTFLGIVIACLRKQWKIIYFAAWLLTAFLLLLQHRPVWYHQLLLIHIPAIILVGYAIGEIITKVLQFRSLRLRFNQQIYLIIFSLVIFVSSILLISEQTKTTLGKIKYWHDSCGDKTPPSSLEYQFFTEIAESNAQTKWMVTDSPMFAFRAGIPVPPSTAILSRKQVETGNITDEQLIDVINKYQPEQVFLRRFEWSKVTNFLNENYQLKKQVKKQEKNLKLYVQFTKENYDR